MNVLLIEDDLQIQELFKATISELQEPIELYRSISARQALNIATETAIDIFIIDIQLTDYKGTELAKQLRALDQYAYTPMIFATALANEELHVYRELKCYHYLIKPFTKDEIKTVLTDTIAYTKHLSQPARTIKLEQRSFIVELDVEKIIYLESFKKKMNIHVLAAEGKEMVEEISGYPLKRLIEMIQDDDFIQCHKSFVVNKRFIYKLDKAERSIHLTVGEQAIPIGNKYMENLLK